MVLMVKKIKGAKRKSQILDSADGEIDANGYGENEGDILVNKKRKKSVGGKRKGKEKREVDVEEGSSNT